MRRFEFVEGNSAKFWMTEVEGNNFIVVYGRLGTPGQRKEKAFASEALATKEMEKKIAEKVREGYQEVASGAAASAPAGEKGAAAASAKLELPPRFKKVSEPGPDRIQKAQDALSALQKTSAKRSFVLARKAMLARRALDKIAGFDPASHKGIQSTLDAVLTRVLAAGKSERISLCKAISLLYALDTKAFENALSSTWKNAAGTPAEKAISVLNAQVAALEDAELGMRVGALLVDRPGRGSESTEAGWTGRWKALKPLLEAHLTRGGGSLKNYLRGIDTAGDAHIARRVARMLAG